MKITTIKISKIAAEPTQRMDAEYWVKKEEEAALVETLKDFYNQLGINILYYLKLKQGDYTINIPDSLFVLYREEAFTGLEFTMMYSYFFNQPPYSTLFLSYKVLGNSIIFNIKKNYK